MSDAAPPQSITKATLKAASRYRSRLAAGDFIIRDAAGRMHWHSTGRQAAANTVRFMIERGQLFERDTDIFGDRSRGQTIGKELADV